MSYSIEVTGSSEEIGQKFDEERDVCAKYGMNEAEQQNINALRNMAMGFSAIYGRVHVSASGHWNATSGVPPSESNPGGTVSSFGRASITITSAPTPVEQQSKEG